MAISPCLSKERQFQATEPSGAPQPFRALRSPMCIPATEPCRVPRESLSSTGRGEKWIAGTPGRPFPRQARGKRNRKHRPCSHDRLFLNSGNFKTGLVGGRLKGKRGKEFQVPQDASARCTDVVMAVSFYLSRKKNYDALFPRLSRKRRSLEHGARL